jgi:pSer/pThr/pTyr-binding forkhead associated (FHA) protein
LKDVRQVITLTLLHPLQSVPVQSWPFETESLIRIGRSTDNEVILYSAVVSRHHVELRRNESDWEIVSLGANGTYINGKRITQMPVVDGMIIRLASSGPKIQIHIEGEASKASLKAALGKRGSARTQALDGSKETFFNSKSTHVEEEN